MEGENDGNANNGEVYAQTQPREKGTLIGEMITASGSSVWGEKRGEERLSEQRVRGLVISVQQVSLRNSAIGSGDEVNSLVSKVDRIDAEGGN